MNKPLATVDAVRTERVKNSQMISCVKQPQVQDYRSSQNIMYTKYLLSQLYLFIFFFLREREREAGLNEYHTNE